MANILDRLRGWLGSNPPPEPEPQSQTALDDAAVERLLTALSMTRDDELSCAEVFALLDEYAELSVVNEAQAAALMPLIQMHLDMCADCHEQYDALRGILEPRENHPVE